MESDKSDNCSQGDAAKGLHTTAARRRAAMSTSRFKGVCYNKKCKRWQASTNAYGKYLYLGLFASEAAAAQVYDLASLKIRGQSSSTNFPALQYFDDNGQLPADDHLDGVIAQLKSEAATQLLAEVQNDPMWQSCDFGSNPMEKVALIRQRVGSRRMTGLEQLLAKVLSPAGGLAAVDQSAEGMAMNDNDDDKRQTYAAAVPCNYDRRDDSLQQLEPLEVNELATVMPMPDLSVPTIQQLFEFDTQNMSAKGPEGCLSDCSNSMLLAEQLGFDKNWLGSAGLPESNAREAPAMGAAVGLEDPVQPPPQAVQQHDMVPLAEVLPPLLVDTPVVCSRLAAPAQMAGQPTPALVQLPVPASSGNATAGSSSPCSNNAGGKCSMVAAQVAAGNPLSTDGSIGCVNISWLQNHLPPHCQLQHVVSHSGGLCGMLYAQPCPAVAGGVLWGSAVWDGSIFRYSQLYGTAAEAVNLCSSVLQLVASGKDQEGHLQRSSSQLSF